MIIDVITVPGEAGDTSKIQEGRVLVAVGLSRLDSTIVRALDSGALKIYPALTIEEAFEEKEQLIKSSVEPSLIILGGERHARKIEGFDLGNSPLEYTSPVVKNKILRILSSTNGTKAMKRCRRTLL